MNRPELKKALDALEEIAGGPTDLLPALDAAAKVFDWAKMEALGSKNFADALEDALREAFAEAYDREAEATGRA
jgi:hypothetical protein